MPASAEIKVSGRISNHLTGSTVLGPLTVSSAAASGQRIQVELQLGDNVIDIPTNASGVVIQFPSDNTIVVAIGGSIGLSDLAVAKNKFCVLTFDTTDLPDSFIINSHAVQTGKLTEITFF